MCVVHFQEEHAYTHTHTSIVNNIFYSCLFPIILFCHALIRILHWKCVFTCFALSSQFVGQTAISVCKGKNYLYMSWLSLFLFLSFNLDWNWEHFLCKQTNNKAKIKWFNKIPVISCKHVRRQWPVMCYI